MQEAIKPIEIVAACDDNYVQHLGVMLCSLLENTSHRQSIHISVIDGGICVENRLKLNKFILDTYGIHINYLIPDINTYQSFPISYHFSHTIYYRISMPLFFDQSVTKVLYLDADMVVKDDIYQIWNIDISDYYAAAVDTLEFDNRYLSLGIPLNSLYFCSGLILINLQKWREDHIMQKVISFIQNNQDNIQMWDQDSLNAILCSRWLPLPLKWNQQSNFFDSRLYQKYKSNDDYMEAIANPSIIHYTGSHKPWHYVDNHPYKMDYYKYLSLTPWHEYKPKKNIKLIIKRLIKIYMPKFLLLTIKRFFSNQQKANSDRSLTKSTFIN
ncbi:MAG: glycosyltransferase family 8 protein [Pseudanabaenaceae cyanobacterium bins.39]|nr:glycosyltransferase family 8 protein [Pseudanabaenaceae cyanobacterium bins.39]